MNHLYLLLIFLSGSLFAQKIEPGCYFNTENKYSYGLLIIDSNYNMIHFLKGHLTTTFAVSKISVVRDSFVISNYKKSDSLIVMNVINSNLMHLRQKEVQFIYFNLQYAGDRAEYYIESANGYPILNDNLYRKIRRNKFKKLFDRFRN